MNAIKKYGLTKVAMALLCVIAAGYVAAYLLGPLVGGAEAYCRQFLPYLECQNTQGFFQWIGGGAIAFLFGGTLSFSYFLEQSYLKLSMIMAILFLTVAIGTAILKSRYERSIQAQ